MHLARRLNALEQRREETRKPFRFVADGVYKPLHLDTSTCTRYLTADGTLTEVVILDGNSDDLSPEELEKFIASFPIEDRRR